MKKSEINKYVTFIKNKFKGMRPGEIILEISIVDGLRKSFPMEYRNALNMYIMLLCNGYIQQHDKVFVSLTSDGYDYLSKDIKPVPEIHLEALIPMQKDKETLFYEIWEIIGVNDEYDRNPYYIKGSEYYNAIKKGIVGLPPTYTQFVDLLPLKQNGAKPSRTDWYKELFMRLNEDQVKVFLSNLSILINQNLVSEENRVDGSNPFSAEAIANNTVLANNEEHDADNNSVNTNIQMETKNIFIVHGHDKAIRPEVELLMTKLGFNPIVLFKEPNMGDTIIEKIEREAGKACYAIVLYTACDLGKTKEDKDDKPRARQNVVFEHGYMCAKLGRRNVAALAENDVEQPGDLSGVLYIPLDNAGAWKTELAKNMKAAGLPVDMNKI